MTAFFFMLKKILTDTRTIVTGVILIVAVAAGVTGWAKHPERLKTLETKQVETEDSVQGLAQNVDKYIAVNEEYKHQQAEQQKLLLKLIEKQR